MEEYIAFDSHKHYTWVEHQQANSGKTRQYRLEHAPGAIRQALMGCSPGTPVAIEATANWYWITDEIEQARCVPRLVHPRRAKLMMGQINKTDKLDTHGLNMLQRNGTLPTVWIPPGPLRELRELTGEVQVKHKAVDETATLLAQLEAEIHTFSEDLESLRTLQQNQEKEALALDLCAGRRIQARHFDSGGPGR